jgi:hypothetical protein
MGAGSSKRIPANVLYGLDKASSLENYEPAISEMVSMTVSFYASRRDAKKIENCASRLVFSLIRNVCGGKVNINVAPCIVTACVMLVMMKLQNLAAIRDRDFLQQIGANCDMNKVYDIMDDLKKRSFSQETCEVIA